MFSAQVADWLSAPTNWTIITGHYLPTDEEPDDSFALTFSRNHLGEVTLLPIFQPAFFDNQSSKLQGFVLEADLIAISPDLRNQLVHLPGVIEEPDSQVFLTLLPQ
jgi:hypothetical protein